MKKEIKSNADEKEWRKDIMFWEGFDAEIDLVMNVFDNSPEKESEGLKDEIEYGVEIYKKDG